MAATPRHPRAHLPCNAGVRLSLHDSRACHRLRACPGNYPWRRLLRRPQSHCLLHQLGSVCPPALRSSQRRPSWAQSCIPFWRRSRRHDGRLGRKPLQPCAQVRSPMTLALIGVNHKTAPIELRERIAISREDLPETTRALADMPGVSECMIVSTCNRVELLATVEGPDTDLAGFLHSHFGLDPALLAPHIYEQRGRDAARHLVQQGAGAILVSNRTQERARMMAEEFAGRVIPFEQLYEAASEADIVITSTGAPHPIFRPEHGQAFLHRRRNRPMFFIDIAVPRDVDPAMGKLEGIFVYDIDDLQAVAAAHMAERSREAGDAETLIAREVERFQQRQRTVNVAPAIVALQRQAEEIRQAELRRVQVRLGSLSAEQIAAVEALTRGLVNKFLHPPIQALKQAAREGNAARLDALCEAWSVSAGAVNEAEPEGQATATSSATAKAGEQSVNEPEAHVEAGR